MKKLILITSLLLICMTAFSQVKVTSLLTENKSNPIGIDIAIPRFSWAIESAKRNTSQTAYEIKITEGKKLVWSSEKVSSSQSVMIDYVGPKLTSNTKYNWQVRVWDNQGAASEWSTSNSFQTALFSVSDWQAKWIVPGFGEASNRPSPIFRKQFASSKKVISAIANITAHGMYEAQINGQRVGDAYLTPGWTSYATRLQYQTYDVTNLMKTGLNAIGVSLGSGWYRGIIGFSNNKDFYGKDIALLFQLNITYSDGSKEVVISDDSWKANTGSIEYSEIYNGETVDARKEKVGWATTNFNDEAWLPAKLASFDKVNLIATQNELVKKQEVFKPIKIFTTPKGEKVIDFGQNLVGWVVMKAKGNEGDKITLSHAEVLDKVGNFYTENLRAAKAQNTYVLSGMGVETFEPHFTWQGFRYLRIEGYPGEITADNFYAVALYSDMKTTGDFTSSNTLVNQLQHNIQWGQKGNFLDVPTDCPQRDERLGWTGDAQVFSRTATFNMNVHSFFAKWLKDLAADQKEGKVPFVVPNVIGADALNSTGWADVATIIPWNLYIAYGDKKILADQYASMKAYVESINKVAKDDLWNSGFHFGDWLFYRPEDDNDGKSAVTDKYLIAQCFYAHSTQLIINAATVLNKKEDVALYTAQLIRVKAAFMKEYVSPNGRLISGTQTAYTLALNFDMLPENLRQQAAKRLVDNIESYGNHLTTGFLGTPYLCHVLTRFGYTNVSYKLLLQEQYPSWLYPVKMGATTIWERWDGQKPDSSFQSVGMNSFNHYSYGAIGDWMYRQMVGLDTYEDGVGYKHSKVQPHIGGGFTNASASLETYYGKLSSGWKLQGDEIYFDVTIPANTIASVFIPTKEVAKVSENGQALSSVNGLKIIGQKEDYLETQLGSGEYHFIIKK
ncbi:MAG: alpha-L-rhamnosidase [Sediminibacterium sp.]|jgi:alpha-L-rhamnosidase|nr:MAG: alpha-L-rhamnosidase [Sediminibacterium sp.]